MVDDTYYITPHEAALAVVATAMKKSRLPFYILFINSIMGGFLFSSGGMLHVMCQAGSSGLIPGKYIFVSVAQGAVYSIGLFYVIICGMELFNSNILYFSVGVVRGAVTLMDLIISWFVSFWVNLASSIFVVYVICYCSGIFKEESFVVGTIAIGEVKNSFTFAENILKGVAGNFFVCLAVYLQIMVKPLHVKFLMIFLPIFTFVSMGFSHAVADMFMVPAAIFNNVGYGFGHYFWKMMLPVAIGNIIGGSFFGIVITWYLHLHVIEQDMKKLKLPAYEETDEQPMLNMDSRVVRNPGSHVIPSEEFNSDQSSELKGYEPDETSSISKMTSRRSMNTAQSLRSTRTRTSGYRRGLSRVGTLSSIRSRNSRQIRSPRGVFPVTDMGPPLEKERTIAGPYTPVSPTQSNDIDDIIDDDNSNEKVDETHDRNLNETQGGIETIPDPLANEDAQSAISGDGDDDNIEGEDFSNLEGVSSYVGSNDDDQPLDNPYNPELEKVSSKLMRAITRTVTKDKTQDVEKGAVPKPRDDKSQRNSRDNQYNRFKDNRLFRQFTFGGGGDDQQEIHRRLSDARITRKAAYMSDDIAGTHVNSVDTRVHRQKRPSTASSVNIKPLKPPKPALISKNSKTSGSSASDRWKHFTHDSELDAERPVSFISEKSDH